MTRRPALAALKADDVVPILVRLAMRPGAAVVGAAAWGVVLVGCLGGLCLAYGREPMGVVALVVAVVSSAFAAVLFVRRRRLLAALDSVGGAEVISGDARVAKYEPGGAPGGPAAAVRGAIGSLAEGLGRAGQEYALRPARFWPRVEAAQRAALAAMGGPVRAPYLRDDLRVTLVALIGTFLSLPVLALTVTVVFLVMVAGS